MIDRTGSFRGAFPKFDEALAGLAPAYLRPHDHFSVYVSRCGLMRSAFGHPVDAVSLRTAVQLSEKAAGDSGAPAGKASCKPVGLWDALMATLADMRDQPGRRVLLVATDGEEGHNVHQWTEVRKLATQLGITIFAVARPQYGATNGMMHVENFLDEVCQKSGGVVLVSTSDAALQKELIRFVQMVRERYIVEFARPHITTPGTTAIEVSISKANLFIRPAGVSVTVEDPALKDDPNTLPTDESKVPEVGKRHVMTPP